MLPEQTRGRGRRRPPGQPRPNRDSVQKIVDDLIDRLLAGPRPVDLVEAFALPVPSLVICTRLGVPYADHEFFQASSSTMIRLSLPPADRQAAGQRLSEYLDDLVGHRFEHDGAVYGVYELPVTW
ncbi:MAG TPA: hypothetical protein VGG75_43555 [Trebonia sp.]|jgi:cytochrome P450